MFFVVQVVLTLALQPTFKKRLWQSCFPVNFAKFLRTPFFIEHLWWLPLYSVSLRTRTLKLYRHITYCIFSYAFFIYSSKFSLGDQTLHVMDFLLKVSVLHFYEIILKTYLFWGHTSVLQNQPHRLRSRKSSHPARSK